MNAVNCVRKCATTGSNCHPTKNSVCVRRDTNVVRVFNKCQLKIATVCATSYVASVIVGVVDQGASTVVVDTDLA